MKKANKLLTEHPSVTFPTLLLITDGLSEKESALQAKEKLVGKIVQHSAILINPTDKADELFAKPTAQW